MHLAGFYVVPRVGLTLGFCQDFLENPNGAYVFFQRLALKNPHGAHVFFSAEPPQRISLGSQGGQPEKRGMAGLGPWEGGVAGNRQWKKEIVDKS